MLMWFFINDDELFDNPELEIGSISNPGDLGHQGIPLINEC